VYTRIPNEGGNLVGGLFASGRVVDRVEEKAVAVPLVALRKEGQEQVVYRVRDGRASRVVVTVGLVDEAAGVAGMSGSVAVGDSLVSGVVAGLKDGVLIRVAAASESGNGAPSGEPHGN
jgi:hypothetical protein